MEHRLLITTSCCPDSIKYKVIKLMFEFNYETFESYIKLKPIWKAFGFNKLSDRSDYLHEMHVNVKFCPFCGVNTPEIELNQHAIDNFKIHDSDLDYCTVCDERNMTCRCLPPEFRWKPVGVNVDIPIMINDEDYE